MKKDSNTRFPDRSGMIWYFMKGSIRYFLAAILFAALVSFLDMVSPKIITFTVDSVIGDDAPAVSPFILSWIERAGGVGYLKTHLLLLALLIAAIGVGAALFRYLFRVNNARGAETLVERMRNTLFGHIMYLPYTWLGENSTGDIIQRCTSDVQTVRRFVAEQLTSLVRTVVLIVMALGFMLSVDRRVTLASAAFIPVVMGYSLFFHMKIGGEFKKADEEEGVLSTIAQENLTGVRVVRAFGREIYERDRFEKQNDRYTGVWVRLIRLMSMFWSSGDVVTGLQVLTVISLSASYCVHGTMTAGEFIAMVAYNQMLIWPVRRLGRVISEMSKAGVAVDRLRYIMNAEKEKDPEDAVEPPLDGDIVFDHVSFSYDGKETGEVLHDVSFTIPSGSTIGILGGTGSGKSTLLYLLLRLYELPPENGHITIGGTDIRRIRAGYLRENLGIVLQEPFLFSKTLSENIAIASPAAQEDAVRYAARIAQVDDAIESFTKGYDTFVGERGVTLSGGQKQRTAIAQMLIRKPPVMIFDDSLSAVDADTDRRIRTSLRESIASSTVILVAHRITTLMSADKIIVLDRGRIAEEGTHNELIEKDGIYRTIFELQKAGLAEEVS